MANPADIVDIIQTPALIKDDFIRTGRIVLDDNGTPIHYTGGFAIVFPFIINNEKWAFRCWYNSIGNIGRRLKILSNELDSLNLPYFCKFRYVERGLVLEGKARPTTRMVWIDGLNIKDYICQHAYSPEVIRNLAEQFFTMCTDLHMHKIAHGDLQHGNIIVDKSGSIYLIDYDSVFLPALEGEKDIITGLGAYQHPSRIKRENIFTNEKLDYFSELVIYLSIIAIAEDPSLVADFNLDKSDNLLFKKEDFSNLKSSFVYKRLIRLGGDVKLLLSILEEYLNIKSIVDLFPFENVISKTRCSNYCIICGQPFRKDDEYCIYCGSKRL